MKKVILNVSLLVLILSAMSCGSSDKESVIVTEEPTEKLIRKYKYSDYSIVLNDMNVKEKGEKREFQHKYHILKVEKDALVVDSLDWQTVNQSFFEKHENDLGMEIVSNHNKKLSRVAQPVGFGWAIGNEKYGKWENENAQDSTATSTANTKTAQTTNNSNSDRRVWRSSGPSLLFWYWMLRRPAYQRDYRGYTSSRTSGRPYYGSSTNGGSTYGTKSAYQKAKRPSFFSRKSASKSWSSFTKSKTSRSSSRYKSSNSTRSRSGGFGK
jgi:hypothetical protein